MNQHHTGVFVAFDLLTDLALACDFIVEAGAGIAVTLLPCFAWISYVVH